MHIHYNKRRGGQLVPNYVCIGRRRLFGDPMCQSIVGAELDAAVGKLLVEAVTPMALEVAIAVQQEIKARLDEADRLRHRQVERAQYEADHARHRYHAGRSGPTASSPTLWKPTGTHGCATSPKHRKSTSASA